MEKKGNKFQETFPLLLAAALGAAMAGMIWEYIPERMTRYMFLAVLAAVFLLLAVWRAGIRRQMRGFSDDLCEILDSLIDGDPGRWPQSYEDSLKAKVQGKLLQFYDIADEARKESSRDKKTIQELVSDISHQVKTPIANIKMFTGILRGHNLPAEKQGEFLATMEEQIDKLDFLMQSLIKMSRLETGTFTLHMEEARLADTIARSMSTVWAKAEAKQIELSAECDPAITARHDPKWTAEALGNLLDNAVKYTPSGGSVTVTVRPWQFYTRVDIHDTGIGIPEEHYNDVFQRFYRAQEVAGQEGVGLGLYLANGIITRQKGYISVKSKIGVGTTFSVYLLS